MELAEIFARQRYAILRLRLKDPHLSNLYKYVCKLGEIRAMLPGDEQVPNSPAWSSDFMIDGLLSDLVPAVEAATALKVFPTYAYFRLYQNGAILKKHTDRRACEISLTLCLGYRATEPWPIWIAGPNGTTAVSLEPGDALLYRGMECAHWREPFDGDHQAQVFLHYVDQKGPCAHWKYDKRPGLAISSKPWARAGG